MLGKSEWTVLAIVDEDSRTAAAFCCPNATLTAVSPSRMREVNYTLDCLLTIRAKTTTVTCDLLTFNRALSHGPSYSKVEYIHVVPCSCLPLASHASILSVSPASPSASSTLSHTQPQSSIDSDIVAFRKA